MAYSIKTIFWLILLNILLLLIISSYLFLFWVLLLPLRFLCIDAYMKIEKVFYDCLLGLIVATEWFSGTEGKTNFALGLFIVNQVSCFQFERWAPN